jgi:hypothetical protein
MILSPATRREMLTEYEACNVRAAIPAIARHYEGGDLHPR